MKMKKFIVAALATAMTVGSVMTASAAWVQEGPSNWRYQNADGTWQAGTWFRDVSGIWYHFDANGLMQKGWFLDSDGKWYFMDYNGAMQTGLIKVDNAVYYMDESGALFLGDKTINGQTYTFGLYGTTNGTPAVGSTRTYGGNGNQSLPGGGGSSRNNHTSKPVTAEEAIQKVDEKAQVIADSHETISEIEVTATEDNYVDVAVVAKAGLDLTDSKQKADVEKAIKEALNTVLANADDGKVYVLLADGETKLPVDSNLDIAQYLTQDMLDGILADKISNSRTVTMTVNGQEVVYEISVVAE